MSKKIVGMVEANGALLVGFFKCVLFLAFLAFLVVQILYIYLLWITTWALPHFTGPKHYLFAVISAVTAILGCYAVLRSHPTHLRIFACVCGLVALLLTAFIVLRTYDDVQEFEESFKHFKNYNWIQNQPDSIVSNFTRHVDQVQRSIACCGLDGPDDWNQYRPEGVADYKYPTSCCFHNEPTSLDLCIRGNNSVKGCLKIIKTQESAFKNLNSYFVLYLAAMGLLSCIMSMAVHR